jgi:PAS domain S-box-containing protein
MNPEGNSWRPELPAEMDAVASLLELARAFTPNFELPKLSEQPPALADDGSQDERIQKAEARYQTLVEQIPAVTFMASFENGLSEIYVSPHIETMLGYTAREWIDDPILWYQRLHPEDKQRWNQEFSRTVSWAEPFRADYRFLAKDGRVVWIHGEATVVRDAAGQPSFVQGIGYDITELKDAEEVLRRSREELEELVAARTAELKAVNESLQTAKDEAERANRSKSEFLSRMSHELRTPLNAILGFGQILEMDATTADQTENAQQVVRAGHHLLGLINEVLDIARIEAGQIALSLKPVELSRLIQEAISLVGPLAADRNIHIAFTPEELHLRADGQRLKQVLLNLLSNAIKYNRRGGAVTIAVAKDGQGMLRISITDIGPGIPPGSVEKLFLPFERLSADDSKIEGTGLGLVVCRQLVELMGGRIGVESTVGEGSTFWFLLPFVPTAPEQAAAPETAIPMRSMTASERHVLLYIDDNHSNLTLLRRMVERYLKVTFFTAMNGADGLALARTHHPDLILLDRYLPGMDGDEILQELRRTPETAGIPVFMISADATTGQAERLLAAGAQAYLTKPLDLPKLIETIEQTLPGMSTTPRIRPRT